MRWLISDIDMLNLRAKIAADLDQFANCITLAQRKLRDPEGTRPMTDSRETSGAPPGRQKESATLLLAVQVKLLFKKHLPDQRLSTTEGGRFEKLLRYLLELNNDDKSVRHVIRKAIETNLDELRITW